MTTPSNFGPAGSHRDFPSWHFFQTKAANGIFSEVCIRFYKTAGHKTLGQGEASTYFTITLTNAALASYQRIIVLPPSGKPGPGGKELEEIRMSYEKIAFEWIKQTVTATDDWQATV